jgi:DNA-binding CsgD family transcriptional regulator
LETCYYAISVEVRACREHLKAALSRYGLTQREAEVLSLILVGYRGIDIARTLYISPATVNDHFRKLLKKTGARNRSEMLIKVLDT